MKKFIYTILAAGLTAGLASCNDWLKEESPGNIRFDDFYTEGTVCIPVSYTHLTLPTK